MIFSILCYIIAGLLLSFLGKQASMKYRRLGMTDNSVLITNEHLFILVFIFFLFFGLRSLNTGVDTQSYVDIYEKTIKFDRFERDDIEPAFKWLNLFYGALGIPTWIFLGTFGLLQIWLVLLSIRSQHFLYPYVCAYIILGPIFLEWANVMRQSLVACAFLYSMKYIEEKKLIKYVIVILLGALMHKSAIILIPFYWILKFKVFPENKFVRIGILFVSFFIGQSSSWISNITVISDSLAVIGLSNYTEHLDQFIAEERVMALGPSRLSLLIVTVWVILEMPKIIRQMHLPKQFEMYFSLYYWGSCAYNIFANTSHLFLRPIQYFTITGVVLVPLLLYYLIKRRDILRSLIYGFLIYWYSTYVSIKAYLGGLGDIDPDVYSFCFLS